MFIFEIWIFKVLFITLADSPIWRDEELAYLIHRKAFQVKFGQLISIQEYFGSLSCAKIKKKPTYLPEYDQLSIAKVLNRKFFNLLIFSIN